MTKTKSKKLKPVAPKEQSNRRISDAPLHAKFINVYHKCYDNKESNCKKYGRLYTWEAARKACPLGWHLASDKEWKTMTSYYGEAYIDASIESRENKNNRENAGEVAYKSLVKGGASRFSALLGGYRDSDGLFHYLGADRGYYWSSTEQSSNNAWYYRFYRSCEYLRRSSGSKNYGRSCRCAKD